MIYQNVKTLLTTEGLFYKKFKKSRELAIWFRLSGKLNFDKQQDQTVTLNEESKNEKLESASAGTDDCNKTFVFVLLTSFIGWHATYCCWMRNDSWHSSFWCIMADMNRRISPLATILWCSHYTQIMTYHHTTQRGKKWGLLERLHLIHLLLELFCTS